MLIENYTTFADIRAALGVNVKELKDETLSVSLYVNSLIADIEEVAVGIPEKYAEVLLEADPDADQTRFLQAVRNFSTYSVARHLTVSLPVFSPVKIEDGKAAMTRVSDPHRETVAAIHREYEVWRRRLLAAYGVLTTASAPEVAQTYLRIVQPSPDPITGV